MGGLDVDEFWRRTTFLGLDVDEFWRWTLHLKRGSASRILRSVIDHEKLLMIYLKQKF